jgi:hypothetical protein
LTFSIFTVLNIKAFSTSCINIAEMVCLILEDLEPFRVGAIDLHVIGLSGVLDVP